MDLLKTIGSETIGLFVDDGSLAVAIILWLVVAWLGHSMIASDWQGPLLFGGLALILIENASRRARL